MARTRVSILLDIEASVIPRIVAALRAQHPEWAAMTDQLMVRLWVKEMLIQQVATVEAETARVEAEAAAVQAAQVRQARIQAILTEGQTVIDAVP